MECLKSRYDRPRIIQRTHVQLILDTPSLKERELRKLHNTIHNTIQQHVRALGTLGCELPGKFITSMIELKLDVDTLFEWQKHSNECSPLPRAAALEVSCASHKTFKRPPSRVTTHATHSHYCVGCKTEKHPLYVCPTFKSMPLDDKMQVLKTNRLCTNCLSLQATM